MNQEKANQIFNSELGVQLCELFSTSDGRVFIRYEEALKHSNGELDKETNPLEDKSIETWYPTEATTPTNLGDDVPTKNSYKVMTGENVLYVDKNGVVLSEDVVLHKGDKYDENNYINQVEQIHIIEFFDFLEGIGEDTKNIKCFNIMAVGYWNKDGEYIEPDQTYRSLIYNL